MQITHLRIKNYRAIQLFDEKIPPKGGIAKGGNARGKTTVLRAVRAALLARDIGPDSIRDGADKAEILIDLDDPKCRVRRTITRTSPSHLDVENAEGDVKKKPQTYLAELFGTSALDPLDLFLAKPAERKKMVLAAMPVKVTDDDVKRWLPDFARELVPSHILDILSGMHGVDACATLHKILYEARAEANASTKEAQNRAAVLEKDVEKLIGVEPSDMTGAEAAAALEAARAEWTQLDAKKKRAIEQSQKFATARAQIKDMRERASLKRESAKDRPSDEAIEALGEEVAKLKEAVRRAEAELSEKIAMRDGAVRVEREALSLEEQAASLERTLDGAVEVAPSEEEIEAAKQKGVTARAAHERAVAHGRAEAARAELAKATEEANQRGERAKALTEIVDRLRVDAPSELLQRSDAIHGLGISGDDLTLDGKSIDAVSGKEQMIFAVEVARRANSKAKILVVDGLERLDEDAFPAFVEAATRDGFQLFATKVGRGPMAFDVIESDPKEEAAE